LVDILKLTPVSPPLRQSDQHRQKLHSPQRPHDKGTLFGVICISKGNMQYKYPNSESHLPMGGLHHLLFLHR